LLAYFYECKTCNRHSILIWVQVALVVIGLHVFRVHVLGTGSRRHTRCTPPLSKLNMIVYRNLLTGRSHQRSSKYIYFFLFQSAQAPKGSIEMCVAFRSGRHIGTGFWYPTLPSCLRNKTMYFPEFLGFKRNLSIYATLICVQMDCPTL